MPDGAHGSLRDDEQVRRTKIFPRPDEIDYVACEHDDADVNTESVFSTQSIEGIDVDFGAFVALSDLKEDDVQDGVLTRGKHVNLRDNEQVHSTAAQESLEPASPKPPDVLERPAQFGNSANLETVWEELDGTDPPAVTTTMPDNGSQASLDPDNDEKAPRRLAKASSTIYAHLSNQTSYGKVQERILRPSLGRRPCGGYTGNVRYHSRRPFFVANLFRSLGQQAVNWKLRWHGLMALSFFAKGAAAKV